MTDSFYSRNIRLTIVNYLDSCLLKKAKFEQIAVADGSTTILCINPDTVKSTVTLYGNCMEKSGRDESSELRALLRNI